MLVASQPLITKPPFGSVQVAWGHPLAQGLVSAWIMNEGGGGIRNLAAPQYPGTLNAGVGWGITAGRIVQPPRLWFDGVSGLVTTPTSILPSSPSAFSMVAKTLINTTGITQIVCNETKAGSLTWGLFFNTATVEWRFSVDSATTVASGAATINTRTHLVGVFDSRAASQETLYVQGVRAGTSNVGATALTGEVFDMGARSDATLPLSGPLEFVLLYRRALSSSEVLWLFAEPYAFLQPIPAVRYWSTPPVAAAVSASGTHVLYLGRAA